MQAVDVWDLSSVGWMWDIDNQESQTSCQALSAFTSASEEHIGFLDVALSMRTPALKQDPMFLEMFTSRKVLEAGE